MTRPIYAVGDIHGQLSMLDDALARIEADGGAGAPVVFLGDYVDRGPDSAGVLTRLAGGIDEGRDWTCLLGNHDRMFRGFIGDTPRSDPYLMVGWDWFHPRLGGADTLASYGAGPEEGERVFRLHRRARAVVPQRHLDFLDSLHTHHERGGLLFVHAGIRPGVALEDQTEDDLIWIRTEFHDHTDPHPWLVVHGHTPVPKATHYGNRVNLDTGAGYGDPLTVAVFEDGQVFNLTPQGRVPLSPP